MSAMGRFWEGHHNRMTCCMLAAWLLPLLLAANGYSGNTLYTTPDPADTGSLVVQLTEDAPRPVVAVALGQRSGDPYLGQLTDTTIRFPHLPIDRYDLLLVTDTTIYEGIRLIRGEAGQPLNAETAAAIDHEVQAIEGFFDHKRVQRSEIAGEHVTVLLQQWRDGTSGQQSAKRLEGSIHSIDLIRFRRPLEAWQLTVRRQLYRQELPAAEPLRHVQVKALEGIRVIRDTKHLGPLSLHPPAKETP